MKISSKLYNSLYKNYKLHLKSLKAMDWPNHMTSVIAIRVCIWHFCNFAPGISFSFDFTAKNGKLAFILTAYDRNFHTAREAS